MPANYSYREVVQISRVQRPEGEDFFWWKNRDVQTSYVEESFTVDGAAHSEAIQVYELSRRLERYAGQRVTVLWIEHQGKRSYLRFWNARDGDISHRATVDSLVPFFRPWHWSVFAAIALGYVIGDLTAPFEFAGLVFAFGAYFVWIAIFMLLGWRSRTALRRDAVVPLLARAAALPG